MRNMSVEELEHGMKLVINSDAVDLIGKMAITNCWNELLRRFEAMKCCGNCQWSISRNCKDWQRYRDCGSYPALDSYCDKWQYDGLTRAERERDRAFK